MPQLELEIKLSSKSKILEFDVFLENSVHVTLFTVDGGKTWTNKDIEVQTDQDLDLNMFCKIFGERDWEFSIKDQLTDKFLYEEKGKTGEDGIPNFSQRIEVIPISVPLLAPSQELMQDPDSE